MVLVLLANNVFVFMVAWELMSLASYFLVVYQYRHSAHRRAAFLYIIMAHASALAILLALALFATASGDISFEVMRTTPLSFTLASLIFGLGLLGFGMKAGLVPLHVWLPEAHPVAPSHISALMSGVMLKIAIYGLIRLNFDLLTVPHWSWGVV